jgi:hypothetical protein
MPPKLHEENQARAQRIAIAASCAAVLIMTGIATDEWAACGKTHIQCPRELSTGSRIYVNHACR